MRYRLFNELPVVGNYSDGRNVAESSNTVRKFGWQRSFSGLGFKHIPPQTIIGLINVRDSRQDRIEVTFEQKKTVAIHLCEVVSPVAPENSCSMWYLRLFEIELGWAFADEPSLIPNWRQEKKKRW